MKLGNNEISKIYLGATEISKAYLGSDLVYGGSGPEPIDYTKEYFTLKALENGHFDWNVESMLYSLNDGAWTTWDNTNGLDVSANDAVRFKDNAGRNGYGNKTISSTGQFNVYGNSMSLFSIYGDNFSGTTSFPSTNGSEFQNLFSGNTNVISAENLILPATKVNTNGYNSMFIGCTKLISAPELPATTLEQGCYKGMFSGCTKLTTIPPVLPATDIPISGYCQMFTNCKKITSTPIISATSVGNSGCTSMFQSCTGLTTASELPATTIGKACYKSMFNGCTSLTTAPSILPATTLANNCYNLMFSGCTSLPTAPELARAGTLTTSCYVQMFTSCSNLNYIKCLSNPNGASTYTTSWVSQVAASGTFVKAANSTWTTGNSGIPNGWTVQDAT